MEGATVPLVSALLLWVKGAICVFRLRFTLRHFALVWAFLAQLEDFAVTRRTAYWQKCVNPEDWKDCAAVAMVWK